MNATSELRERRHALLFTVEQGCRRQGIHDWPTLRRYLHAVTHTPQGRALLLDATDVVDYIAHRQQRLATKHQSAANRTADRILAMRDRQLGEAFARLVDALPALD